jgi:hypothetical protein
VIQTETTWRRAIQNLTKVNMSQLMTALPFPMQILKNSYVTTIQSRIFIRRRTDKTEYIKQVRLIRVILKYKQDIYLNK